MAALKGWHHTEEARRRIGEASRGNQHGKGYKHTPEALQKIADASRSRRASAETRQRMSDAQRGRKRTPEQRRRMSEAQRGKVLSAEHRAAIAAGTKGHRVSDEARQKMSSALQARGDWRGDDVGYAGLHARLKKLLPAECAHCGATENLDVALRHEAPWAILKVDHELAYSLRAEDYLRLCRPCHLAYDLPRRTWLRQRVEFCSRIRDIGSRSLSAAAAMAGPAAGGALGEQSGESS